MVLASTMVFTCAVPSYASPQNVPEASVESVQSRERTVTIHAGEKKLLSILYIGAKWTSSDPSVVTASAGVITGKNPGTATVKADFGILGSEEWNVTVTEANVKDKGNVTIQVDDQKLLSVLHMCSDWSSSDSSIVTVKYGVVTGKSEGEATVIANSALFGSAKWTVTVEDNDAHEEHTWNEGVVTTAATCVKEGVKTFTCTACGETKTEVIPVDPNNHEKVVTDTKAATCTEEGTETVKCESCGTVISETMLPATGHAWDQGTVTKEATCTTEGEITYTCAACGEKEVKALPVDATNHKDIEEVTTEPTCTEGGKVSKVCKDCGTVISETVIPAKGHTEVTEHKDPTETEDGYNRVVCSVCGEILSEEILSATGHAWDEGVVTKEATCIAEGIMTYTCKDCGATYTESIPVDPENHANVSTKKTEATCTEDGVEITYCADCGKELDKNVIPAVGHSWKEGTTSPATCVAEGKTTYLCENCGETKEEPIPVDPDNHVSIQTKTEDATCTEDGKITTYCADCGKVFEETAIPATGHEWGEGEITTPATCVAEGEKTYTCDKCGQTQTEALPVDPQNHANVTTETEDATCTTEGVTVTYCKDCDTVLDQEVLPAKGHTEVKEHKDPTATENGYDRVVCSVCGEVISETVLPAIGEQKEATLVSGAEINVKMKYLAGTISKLPNSYKYSNSFHKGADRNYGVFNVTDDVDTKTQSDR